MKVSMYRNSTDTIGAEVDYLKVLDGIKTGRWQKDIQNLAQLLQEGLSDSYAASKRLLPAVTFAGTFSERLDDKITTFSGMMVIDIDKLDTALLKTYQAAFVQDNFIHAMFVSPSGKGLKLLVKVSSEQADVVDINTGAVKEYFLKAFLVLEKYFADTYAIVIDPTGKNLSRLCYVSYDPELWLNENSEVIKFDAEKVEVKSTANKFDDRPEQFKGHVLAKDAKYIFNVCEKWTQRTYQFEVGDRNNYIHVLACNLNRTGVHIDDALLMIYNNYSELPYKEIEQSVRSAYKTQSEHNTIDVYNLEGDAPEPTPEGMTAEQETIYNDTISLLRLNVDKRVINKLVKVFGISHLSMSEKEVSEIMNRAVSDNDENSVSLNHTSAEDMLLDIADAFDMVNGASTLVPEIDEVLGGGLMPANLYGFVGDGGTFKSILAQCIGSHAATHNELVLYLNGEMSGKQLLDRVMNKELHIELIEGIKSGNIKKDDMPGLAKELSIKLNGCFEMVNGSGWNKDSIIKTIKDIEKKHKKKVSIIIVDGLSQMEDAKRDEIKSAIYNSGQLKELAKDTNSAIIMLAHCSGGIPKHVRDTSKFVRGGTKLVNNMDAMFCTSLCIDESKSNFDTNDILYLPQKFYLRFIDKRGSGAIVNKIIKVMRPMELIPLDEEAESYEVKTS